MMTVRRKVAGCVYDNTIASLHSAIHICISEVYKFTFVAYSQLGMLTVDFAV